MELIGGMSLEISFVNVKIGIDILDIFMVFQYFHEGKHLEGMFSFNLNLSRQFT